MNADDYNAYVGSFLDFMEREGIVNLSLVCSEDDLGPLDPFFSWRPCECCRTTLGGNRYQCSGYNPSTQDIYEYECCEDCVYFAEYGCLDDMTMDQIERSRDDVAKD